MKKYFLLRNNQESGPFGLEDLKLSGLQPLDLVWIENESSGWEYPSEIEVLKAFIIHEPRKEQVQKTAATAGSVYISLPPGLHTKDTSRLRKDYESYPVHEVENDMETTIPAGVNEINRDFQERPVWQKKMPRLPDAFRMAALFAGLFLGAFLVKKTADSVVSNEEKSFSTQAQVMPDIEASPAQAYSNALVTETMRPVAETSPVRSVKPKDIRRQVKVRSNDYKTGVFGGINGLKLTVTNASPHFVNTVTVSVQYLKKNGEVIGTENYEVHSLKPGGIKTISVPAHRRGVKVRTSIDQIYSKEYKAALQQV